MIVWKGIRIYPTEGDEFGVATGTTRRCQLEGCTGVRVYVRWPDGRLTMPCSKGMSSLGEGGFRILA